MSDVKHISRLMRELEEQLTSCMRCGMCQAVCPLFDQTGLETDVARGKLALLDGLISKLLDDPEGVAERLNRCLLCGSCAANCPSGVKVPEIFMKARAILTGYMGLSPVKRLLLRQMLARPAIFNGVARLGAAFQDLLAGPVDDADAGSCARFTTPLMGNRRFPLPARHPFHEGTPRLDTPAAETGLRVAFFPGCLPDKMFPNMAEAAVKALSASGTGVYMPSTPGCCGIPAVSSGDRKTFRKLLEYNIDKYERADFDYLVTACATCTATIKHVWPMLIQGDAPDLAESVREIAGKTMDIGEFLVDVAKVETEPSLSEKSDGENRIVVTYHDPCHLKKTLGVSTQPRKLINANPGYELREMPQSDWCCGMGGGFNLEHYNLSRKIGLKKKENIAAVEAQCVATGCPACMLQLSDMLSGAGDTVQIRHFIEIYADTL